MFFCFCPFLSDWLKFEVVFRMPLGVEEV